MTDIKPRVDDDGVPWCDKECPQAKAYHYSDIMCAIDSEMYDPSYEACPHAVRRMALALKAFESGELFSTLPGFRLWVTNYSPRDFDTLEAAIDALEREDHNG